MEKFNNIIKISIFSGFILGLIILLMYNKKIGNSGSVYAVIIIVLTTLYGYLGGFLYKLFKNKNCLNIKGWFGYFIIMGILTALLYFSIYVIIFALDFTGGY